MAFSLPFRNTVNRLCWTSVGTFSFSFYKIANRRRKKGGNFGKLSFGLKVNNYFYPPLSLSLSVHITSYIISVRRFSGSKKKKTKREMLAVFEKSVAKSPEGLKNPNSGAICALKDGFAAKQFTSLHPGSVTINLGVAGLLAYSLDKQNPLLPRWILQFNSLTRNPLPCFLFSFCFLGFFMIDPILVFLGLIQDFLGVVILMWGYNRSWWVFFIWVVFFYLLCGMAI